MCRLVLLRFFFSSRSRHTRWPRDWSSDVCSSDLTGDLVDARTAQAIGLVNRVVPGAELGAATTALARQIAAKSALTVAIGKEAFYRQAELGLADAYSYAAQVMTRNMLAADAAEGIDAFLEKRPPVWQDA